MRSVHVDCPVLQSLYLDRYSLEGTKNNGSGDENKLVLLSRVRKRLELQTFLDYVRSSPA